jgi:cysteine desulfurase
VHPAVADLAHNLGLEVPGNAAAEHPAGHAAREALARAREQLAAWLGAAPERLWFTSGGTESNNWALTGWCEAHPTGRVVTTAIEHKSVLATAEALSRSGRDVTILGVGGDGRLDPAAVEAALHQDGGPVLVSVMAANNETGVLQPLVDVAELCRVKGATLHTDAVAAAGRLDLDVGKIGCQMLSLSSHKLYAPKGCGLLYVAPRESGGLDLPPLLHGCGQQAGLRSGTENTAAVAAFGLAAELAGRGELFRPRELENLREHLWAGLLERISGLVRNPSASVPTLANTLNFQITGQDACRLQAQLARAGFSVAVGASGSSGAPSHVLSAMGLSTEEARASLRVSLGRDTTTDELDRFRDALTSCLKIPAS